MRVFLSLIATALLISCGNSPSSQKESTAQQPMHHMGVAAEDLPSTGFFGAEISPDSSNDANKVPELLAGKDSIYTKLSAHITEVCQMSGCWMHLDMGEDEFVQVTFKDYAFFVPKDAAGKHTVIEGWLKQEEIPVDMLKHYAQDAGKSQQEIDQITEPEMTYTFEAKGVIIE